MGDYTGVLPSSLQPWTSRTNPSSKSFASVLGRIYHERGHFRDIGEASLRDEIATAAVAGPASPPSDESDADSPTAGGNAGSSTKPRAETLQAARREVIEHVAAAQNETLLALDFVSLLLSKDVKSAEATMSPFLKQSVPSGTLGLDMWAGMEPDPAVEKTDGLLARGKRMQMLGESAEGLMRAAERLRGTVERERRYWDEVLRLKEEGWAVCRVPRERGALGVRYGFGEAQGEFKSRGLAALRMGAEGEVVLDRGLGREGKALRVRVKRGEEFISQSQIRQMDEEEGDISTRIKTARDSLFEEELWHEIMREGRDLGAYGVKLRGNTLSIPMSYIDERIASSDTQQTIELDLVTLDDSTPSGSADPLPNSIATTLRLLLSHTHRQRLERRSQIPPPLNANKQTKATANIIRPLLAHLHHRAARVDLHANMRGLTSVLQSAGITASLHAPSPFAERLSTATSTATLLSLLTKPPVCSASIKVDLPTPNSSSTTINPNSNSSASVQLSVETVTGFEPPRYGTIFAFYTREVGRDVESRPEFETTLLEEMMGYIAFALRGTLTRAVIERAEEWSGDWRTGRVEKDVGLGKGIGEAGLRIEVHYEGGGGEGGREKGLWRVELVSGKVVREWAADRGEKRSFWEIAEEMTAKGNGD